MRRRSWVLALAGAALLLAALAPGPARPRQAAGPEAWRSGDLLFLEGNSWRSWVVRVLELRSNDYSHVGLVVVQGGTPYVIHADPRQGRVVKERWAALLAPDRASGAALYRIKAATPLALARACAAAEGYLAAGVLFDDDFDLADERRLYCTELVWRAYLAAGIDLRAPKRGPEPKYFFPSALIEATPQLMERLP